MRKRKYIGKGIIVILVGTTIAFGGLMVIPLGEEIQASSWIKEFIAEYGGYGLKGEWETLGKASANMIFEDEEGSGWIMLGENKYLVEVLKEYVIEQEGENSTVYEGNLIENEGIVRFAVYEDVMVGEIEIGEVTYSFGVAQTLESARHILDQYNEHLEEEIEPLPFEDLIVPDDRVVIPATMDIDPDTLNLKSKGDWITVYIELPAHPELPEFDVTQIDLNTVRLNDQIPAENNPKYDFAIDPDSYLVDHDNDGLLERIVKFDKAKVQELLEPGDTVKIELTGSLIDGRPFYGLDWIRVIGEKNEKIPTTLEEYSNDFGEGIEISEEFLAELVSEDQGFAEPELPEEVPIPGKTEGVGTYFKIKDSEYLNIVLKSSEEIKVVLESIPRMISLNIEPASEDIDSIELTIEALVPNKTYYKYQDSYKNEVIFNSDGNGSYTWGQNLTQPHHIWIQEIEATTYIDRDTILDHDITGSVEITADNITLNCNGHSIIGSDTGYGIYLNNRQGITLKNCIIAEFSFGIFLVYSENNVLTDNSTKNNGWHGIALVSSNWNILTSNIVNHNKYGIFLGSSSDNELIGNTADYNTYDGIHIHSSSDNNNITGNIASNNDNFGIYLGYSTHNSIINNSASNNRSTAIFLNHSSYTNVAGNTANESIGFGIFLDYSKDNKIYHNNFIDNLTQVYERGSFDNLFDNGYPAGGNYWSDYTGVDLYSGPNQDQPGSDGIGDTPYTFIGGQDKYPFIKENGWEPVVPRERIVSVYAVADEEYRAYYNNWWNPWDEDQWISEMIKAVELGDNAFEKEFGINFVVKDIDIWYSDDNADSLSALFDEARREKDKGTNDIMVAFTNQNIKGNLREALIWGPYVSGILGLAEGKNLGTEEAILGDDIIIVLVKNQLIDNVHQHEYSHLFGVPDHGWHPSGLKRCDPAIDSSMPCIMWYDCAMKTNEWCSSCYSIINANKWREF